MSEQNKLIVRRLIDQVWSGGDFSTADELVAQDYVGYGSSGQAETHGLQGYKQFFMSLRAAFPDIKVTLEDQIADSDRVVTRWTAHGTHRGEFAGAPATGNVGSIGGTTIYRLSQSKVIECWTNSDDLGLLRLVGILPAPVA